jgi:hypothetical protein
LALRAALVGSLSLAAGATSQAAINSIASDDFTGDGNGALGGATGGTGWTSPWTLGAAYSGANWSVSSTSSASYPGVAGPLGQMSGAYENLYDNYRSLPLQNSGIVYVQILANYANYAGNGYGQIRLGLNNPGGYPIAYTSFILSSGYAGPGYYQPGTWGIGGTAGFSFSSTALGSQTLLLEQINYNTGTSELWVNPTLSGFNYLNPTATPDATIASAGAFNDIEFLNIAGTVNQVSVFSVTAPVPEPSTAFAGCFGLLAIAAAPLRAFRKKNQA